MAQEWELWSRWVSVSGAVGVGDVVAEGVGDGVEVGMAVAAGVAVGDGA